MLLELGKRDWEEGKETTRRNNFSLLHFELFVLSARKICEAQNELVNKSWTSNSQGGSQIMLDEYCIISQMKKYCSEVSI